MPTAFSKPFAVGKKKAFWCLQPFQSLLLLENEKKNRQKSSLAIMNKSGTYIDYDVKPYLCTKFGDSSLKNEFRNAKRGWLIKWSIMRIFNEAEPPWSNLSEILG